MEIKEILSLNVAKLISGDRLAGWGPERLAPKVPETSHILIWVVICLLIHILKNSLNCIHKICTLVHGDYYISFYKEIRTWIRKISWVHMMKDLGIKEKGSMSQRWLGAMAIEDYRCFSPSA